MRVLNIEEVTVVSGGLGQCNRFEWGKMFDDIKSSDIIGAYEHLIDATSYIFERILG